MLVSTEIYIYIYIYNRRKKKIFFFFLGLHAFEHEGIQNITALKDQLIAANHNQSEAILKRHADVIDRY